MKAVWITAALALLASPGAGRDLMPIPPDAVAVMNAAHRLFADLPSPQVVARMTDVCGADRGVNDQVAFCASNNVIYYRADSFYQDHEAYELAHVLGHAIQVRHGVADVALREIRRRRDEEDKLRGWVTRQVECIAGYLFLQANLPKTDLHHLYDAEPMTGSHWGRDPLSVGPKVSIGLDARAEWFAIGQEGDLNACAVGEFGADLLLKALR
ncbi:hypothetical protein thalar_01932 [Litoreibacter arenae DSM 19593]|uniref:Uncharacterized protein n=2 Tax=Litoreibacter TaxID=947567 RepID=S9QHV1_9RHOB|nr:hypothetical protein thalar_01932 [Litoreibacter arenae DSM 19593]